jgi:intracellular sulfur oxidation DsrE/DsrF family protein
MSKEFSDEYLNAYLDNQLDADEQREIMNAVRRDSALSLRLCRLQKVRDLVKLAHQDTAIQNAQAKSVVWNQKVRALSAVAATALFVLGLLVGWYSHEPVSSPRLAELAQNYHEGTSTDTGQNEYRLLIHLTQNDLKRAETMLDEAEELLINAARHNQKVKLEVVANGPGLKLIENSDSPYVKKLRALHQRYQNFELLACNIALQRYQRRTGKKLELVPGTRIVSSALHQVIERQREGWAYIRI